MYPEVTATMSLRITGKKAKARTVQATKRAQQADRFLAASVDYGIYPGSQKYESCNKYTYRVKNTDFHKAAFWSFISMLYLTCCVALRKFSQLNYPLLPALIVA